MILLWKLFRFAKKGGLDHTGAPDNQPGVCEFVNAWAIPADRIVILYFNGDKGMYEMFWWGNAGEDAWPKP